MASAERGEVDEAAFVDNQVPPPDEQARGQLLRALASDAIRGPLERHFGVTLAFQNCHRVAVFPAPGPSCSTSPRPSGTVELSDGAGRGSG